MIPEVPATIDPPRWQLTLGEFALPLRLLRWAPQWPAALLRRRAPQPRTVMLLPGFGAGPRSMQPLALYLRAQGHRVHHWGLGRNGGDVQRLLDAAKPRLRSLAQSAGGPVDLVGWSLGGYLAREIARDEPALVRSIVTLGSPVVGGPRFTAVSRWYRARGHDLRGLERQVAERYAVPLRVPVTAVYSRTDGVVAWRSCIDHWSPQVRHVEVAETHLGLGFAPRVLTIVANALQGEPGRSGSPAASTRSAAPSAASAEGLSVSRGHAAKHPPSPAFRESPSHARPLARAEVTPSQEPTL